MFPEPTHEQVLEYATSLGYIGKENAPVHRLLQFAKKREQQFVTARLMQNAPEFNHEALCALNITCDEPQPRQYVSGGVARRIQQAEYDRDSAEFDSVVRAIDRENFGFRFHLGKQKAKKLFVEKDEVTFEHDFQFLHDKLTQNPFVVKSSADKPR